MNETPEIIAQSLARQLAGMILMGMGHCLISFEMMDETLETEPGSSKAQVMEMAEGKSSVRLGRVGKLMFAANMKATMGMIPDIEKVLKQEAAR